MQVAQMVRSSTPRSLLLIDEFGKGTAPADGIGLVAALLRHLSRTGRKCLFTLHFHEIFRSSQCSRLCTVVVGSGVPFETNVDCVFISKHWFPA